MIKTKIVHLITDLACYGGAQNVLCSLLPHLESTQQQIYTISEPSGPLFEYLNSRGIVAIRLNIFSFLNMMIRSYRHPSYFVHCHLTLPFYLSFFSTRVVLFIQNTQILIKDVSMFYYLFG